MQLRLGFGACAVAFTVLSLASPAEAARKVRVALVVDSPAGMDFARAQADTIREVASGDSSVEIEVPPALMKVGDGRIPSVRRALDELIADKTVDMVVLLGTLGSHEAVRRPAPAKPLIAARVLDPRLDGAPGGGPGSAVKNLVYVSDADALGRDLRAIHELGGVSKIAILVGPGVLEGVEGLAEGLRTRAREAGLEASVAPASAASVTEVDAAYLLAIEDLGAAPTAELIRALTAKKVRSFSSRGALDVQAGVVAGLTSLDDLKQRARRVAIDVSRLAGGDPANTIATSYQRAESFYLNQSAAQEIGWTPSFSLLAEAEVIGSVAEAPGARPLTLEAAVKEAAEHNQDFEANRLEIQAASENLSQAIANFLPKAEIQLRGLMIDTDRAKAGLGTQPEQTFSGVLGIKGVLYSDKVVSNYLIQDDIQGSREAQRSALALDLSLETARAYLAVLQTRVLETVRLENVRKTRANLNQARLKKAVGSAGPTEVLRWESQIAIDRREVLRARSLRRLAETQLNRLLHRPLEEALTPAEEAKDQSLSLLGAEELAKVIDNERAFAHFRDFLADEGVKSAPEIQALKQAVAASQRAANLAFRSFFVPTLGYQAELAYRFAKGGAGQDPPQIPMGVPPDQAVLLAGLVPPPVGAFTWQLVGVLSLPLPTDTAAFSDLRRAEAELAKHQAALSSAQEKIEQRVRSAAFQVASSHPGVALARASAESAQKGFAIAQEAYGSGALGVLELLDAQNVALIAELLAVNAKYEFMSDELGLERSVGTFFFLKSKEDRDDWLRRSLQSVNHP
ncbi:MAG: TolC family protein [Myxococcota bacterium]